MTGQRDYLEGAEGLHFDSPGNRCGAAGATTPSGVLCRPSFGVDEGLAGRYYVRSRDRSAGTDRLYRTSLSLAVAVIGPGTGEGGAGV